MPKYVPEKNDFSVINNVKSRKTSEFPIPRNGLRILGRSVQNITGGSISHTWFNHKNCTIVTEHHG